ncbi:MAG: PucR family transcriptional regulator ligand-binding domain-containing protein [Nocardioidaceae bacterium]
MSAAGITVEEILRLPEFARVKVVGGHGGITRRVRNVNIMEVPDILGWVKPDELLLTTGYPLRDAPEGLPALLARCCTDARRCWSATSRCIGD